MNKNKLLILGAGEYGHLVKEIAKDSFETIDFLDDNSKLAIGKLCDYKNFVKRYECAIVAIGNSATRMFWLDKLEQAGYFVPPLVSCLAFVSPSSKIGAGCLIEPMAVVNSNVVIEKGTIISSGAIVNHNSTIKSGCHIDCNAVVGADVIVLEGTHLNYGCVIKNS